MSEYRLEVRGVTKVFPGTRALDQVQLQVRPGEVHALCGENGAGKSTLMNIIGGVFPPTEGEILFEGAPIAPRSPKEAQDIGIGFVHQELSLCPHLTAAENIFIGRLPHKGGMIDFKRLWADADMVLKQFNANFPSSALVSELTVSEQQIIEIAKSVSLNCKLLILDEPTSSLTAAEVEALFTIVNELRSKGVAIVYISHKMDEILRISDEVTIMRDGQYIGTWAAKDLDIDTIITKMVGRELTNLYPERHNVPGDVVFEVEDFTSINPKSFRNVSFNVRKGEILGVAGLVGAQRTELMEGLFGLRCHSKGHIRYAGKELTINQPADAIKKGIAMLTEDRRATGILGVLSIADNVSIASLNKYLVGGIMLDDKKIEKLVQDNVAKLSIKTPSSKTLIQSLSGGNQQKVLISRWLANDPDVFILDEPTRGIDVGAKYEIYCIIEELARQGKSIIMISSEMPELLGICDRVLVLSSGHLTGEYDLVHDREHATQENIMVDATKFV